MFEDKLILRNGIMARVSTHTIATLLFTSWNIAKNSWGRNAENFWEYKVSMEDVNSNTIPVLTRIFTAMCEENYQLCCKLENEKYCFYVKEVEE